MNIQIFGTSKCFETKKTERYFKERKIKYQFIDIHKFGISKGEYNNIKKALGGYSNLVDEKSKLFKNSTISYLSSEEAKEEKILENPKLFTTPIVRNGKFATVGYKPEVWE